MNDTIECLAMIESAIVRLRAKGWSEEKIVDEVARIMAETLPERS